MKIKVAAIQMNCELANVDANLAKAEALLKEAVEKGAKWVIFPELFNTAYWIPKQDVELAEDIPDGRPMAEKLREAFGSLTETDDWEDDSDAEMDDTIVIPPDSPVRKVGRNDPCPCGSGKKYKKCCGKNL